ncbi:MAG: M23 family metallopeptidase [Candidatus Aenigmarchaeota archaeon]|nr:M23 family metallopeptidase [Candidatus Aenigmarchaeota archaeon]
MKGFSVLPIFVGVVVAVVSVIAIVASLVIFVVSVISLQFFGAGGIEVIGTFNKPYVVANTLVNSEIDGKPLLEPVIVASMTKVDAATLSKASEAIKELLDNYDFPYIVRLEGASISALSCTTPFRNDHKAADISSNCGTPVKAICGGRLSTLGPGLTGDKVFGGTAFGGKEGLEIEHKDICDLKELRGYRSFYGCIEILDRKARNVKRGEVIGYVSTCGAEKQAGCHLHFGITKGALDDAEDPKICDKLSTVLEEGTNVLARKGAIDEESFAAEASIPLLFKDRMKKLVVTIGEG